MTQFKVGDKVKRIENIPWFLNILNSEIYKEKIFTEDTIFTINQASLDLIYLKEDPVQTRFWAVDCFEKVEEKQEEPLYIVTTKHNSILANGKSYTKDQIMNMIDKGKMGSHKEFYLYPATPSFIIKTNTTVIKNIEVIPQEQKESPND